ncbi:GNAT family N-acetyltransferase [Tateyamaria sp. SN6-1]|uniref:GNAT family N-acetyltransferase n=1 Tax=Tateyamaria sp. SN6-1 TaxID=3092148 RepID=UPI0039F49F1F
MERPWSAAEFETLLGQPHTRLAHVPQGFALWRGIAGEAELLTIAVDPSAQGHGIGTAVMHRWMADAATTCDTAFLEVAADNAPARALYAKTGFAQVGLRPAYYARGTAPADALILRAALSQGG